jgi:hypothetical protein
MPYEAKEHGEACPVEAGDGWDVVNVESEEVKEHHEEKPDAERQVRLLSELEKEGE